MRLARRLIVTTQAHSVAPAPSIFFAPILTALNHVLRQEPWALQQLQAYVGKMARLETPVLRFNLVVAEDGSLQLPALDVATAQTEASPNVTITLSSQALSAWATGGQEAVLAHVKLSGDAEFANTLSQLAKNVRWDVEEDLSKLVGDALAYRMVQDARSVKQHLQATGQALRDNVLEYLLDEQPALVRRAELEPFSQGVSASRDHLARLEKRLAKLLS